MIHYPHKKTSNPGFTLIEALLYLGLFALIMGGISVFVYGLIEADGRNQSAVALQEEGNFLLGKLDFALSSAGSINAPAAGAFAGSLSINEYAFANNPLVFDLSGGNLRLKQGSAAAVPLNMDQIKVTAANFFVTTGAPAGIIADFTLTTQTATGRSVSRQFELTKYLRQ